MDWIIENIDKAIWQFFADIANDTLKGAFSLIIETIVKNFDPNKYVNVNAYLFYAQAIAGSLLVLAVVWEGFKQLSGGIFESSEKSIGILMLKTTFSGVFIFLLPSMLLKIIIPACNALVLLIQSVGVTITEDKFNSFYTLSNNLVGLGALTIIMWLVLAVSFLILAIAGGIRYIELIICIIIAPFAAVSIVRDGEGLQVWVRETVSIVFTQAIHVLLLQILLKVLGSVQGLMMLVLSIGAIATMLKGPQLLRNFLYSSGVGSGGVGVVGSAGRMAAMKYMMKSAVPMS